jgi:LAS superfamily LD-carboxypeptidase LdcB
MARVPYSPVPDVSPSLERAPQLQVRVDPAAFGSTVAQAVQHLGATTEQVGNELTTRAIAMQQLRNETDTTNALSQLELKSGDAREQYFSTEGHNAVDGYAKFRDDQNAIREQIRGTLANPEAQRMFDRSALSVVNRAVIAGAGHAASENKKAAATADQTAIDAAADGARYAADDNEFNGQLSAIAARTKSQGDLLGLDADSINQLSFKNQSKAIANRIEQVSKEDPTRALSMLDSAVKNRTLHSQDLTRVESQVHGRMDAVATRQVATKTIDQFTDPETFLSKRGGADVRAKGIDPEFGQRLTAALSAAERATGERATIDSLVRSTAEQAEIYARHQAMPGGVWAHPAAKPGSSYHETGDAADIQSGPVLRWLHDHAEEYGLSFLKGGVGQRDPGHIQLASGPNRNPMRTYDIPEKDISVEARIRAQNILGDRQDPEFVDRAESAAISLYRRNEALDRDNDMRNKQTIVGSLQGDNPPQTMMDLLKQPGIESAYYNLKPTDRNAIRRMVEHDAITDPAEKWRLMGESTHEDSIEDFKKEDILNNPKLSNKDKTSLFALQNHVRQKSETDAKVSFAYSQLEHMIPEDIKEDKEAKNRFRGALQDVLNQYKQVHGSEAKGQDLQDIGARLLGTQEMYFGRPAGPENVWENFISRIFHGSPSRLIDIPVPSSEYNAIKNEIISSKGVSPTDEQIQQSYVVKMYKDLYEKKEKKEK